MLKWKHFISLVLLCTCLAASAFHIVGGGFNLTWIGGNFYELHLRILRDCAGKGAGFDSTLYVGIFDKGTDARITIIAMDFDSVRNLEYIDAKCISQKPNFCVEEGFYTTTIELTPSQFNNSQGYYFSWERCCRNTIIGNIIGPASSGMTFYMEIPPPRLIKNCTPGWTNNPRTLLCKGNPFSYNFDFVDPDKDSLHYSLVNPLQGNLTPGAPVNLGNPLPGPYQPTRWEIGFSNNAQISGTPELTIDPNTGEINVTPDVAGVFVSAIRVEEFRFGKKLGEVRLELQYTVTECNSNPPPVIYLTDTNGKTIPGNNISVQIPDKLCFNVVAADGKDSLYVKIAGKFLDANLTYKPEVARADTGLMKTSTRFCWQTSCDMTGIAPQTFTVEALDNGCPLPRTQKTSFTITVKPMPLINPNHILCMTLVDNKETIIYWGDSTGNNPYFYKYNLYRGFNNTSFTIIDSIPDKNMRQYTDKNTPDYGNINYTYFMRGVNKCGYEGPRSDTMGTFDQLKYTPDQQKFITVTVENNDHIRILWPPTREKDFAQYLLYKTTRGDSGYRFIKNFVRQYETSYNDYDVDLRNTSYCYHLVMKDTCGNIGPMGQPSCSIVLKGKSNPFEHSLSWLPYNYWENGTECYNLFRKDSETPYALNNVIDIRNTDFLDDQLNRESGIFRYVLEARERPSDENMASFDAVSLSNEIELVQKPLIYVPNAFTANDDGLNDDWEVHHVFVKDYSLKIYNRWGQLVFETTNKHQHWNGEITGAKAPPDVYVYVINYTGWDESAHLEKGNITMVK